MATRYYPAVKTPNVRFHGGAAGTWATKGAYVESWNPAQWTWRYAQTKVDAGAQSLLTLHTNQQGNHDFFIDRFVTPPLAAQTLTGTFQWCFGVQATWLTGVSESNDSIVRYKLHVYIAQGQSHLVRTTLINNVVDSVDFPGTAGQVWRSLAAAQAVAGSILEGDVIVVERGFRVISSPTPAPTYPPSDMTKVRWRSSGADNTFADAVAGDTVTNRAPWVEFSMTLTEQAPPAAPANGTCATAIAIPALPYQSPDIDTTAAPGTEREVWWSWVAPTSDHVYFHTFGGNSNVTIAVFKNGCGVLTPVTPTRYDTRQAAHRSQSTALFLAVAGTAYLIRVRNTASANNAPNSGGLVRLSAFYKDIVPQTDDVYAGGGYIMAIRGAQIVNMMGDFYTSGITGLAIDYTKRTMDDLNGGTHSDERLLIGLHNFELVELIDLKTLSYFPLFQFEIDFIGDPWSVPLVGIHPAQIHVTKTGLLYVGWFGDGYLYVGGIGTLPAFLNTVSSLPAYSALKTIDAVKADSQPGNPFTDLEYVLPIEVTAPWAIALDEAAGVLYYTSGGVYVPVGGQRIKRWNVATASAMADLAIVTLKAGKNPGLKGLAVLPGGAGVLVCNSTVIERYDAWGVLVATYTPSIADDSQTLVDVVITESGGHFWTLDLATTRMFRFNLGTGLEDLTVQPFLVPGSVLQLVLYAHTCECCVSTKINIINESLLKIGVSKTITVLGEQTREAITMERLYDKALRETLRHHPWAFATKYADSADAVGETEAMFLVAGGAGAPINGDWTFAYRYPDDCLFARRLVPASGSGRQFDRNPIPFRVGRLWDTDTPVWDATKTYIEGDLVISALVLYVAIAKTLNNLPPNASFWRALGDPDAPLVFTNEADAVLEYTAFVECAANFFDALFEDALSWRLASKGAPSLSRIDAIADKCWTMYLHTLKTATAVSSRESQQEKVGEADWIQDRT